MPNMENIIKNHNNKLINKPSESIESEACNCNKSNKPNCPLKGNCQTKSIIYEATIKTDKLSARYIGSTANTFKERYTGHKQSFKDINKKSSTQLSKFVWENHLNPTADIKWKVISKCKSYCPGDKLCQLCLTEKLLIMKNLKYAELLNTRNEIARQCPHKTKFRLGKLAMSQPSSTLKLQPRTKRGLKSTKPKLGCDVP